MALSVAKGTFTARTTTGTTAVTGLGFQPKALIVWTVGATATGFSAHLRSLSLGMTDGTNSRTIVGVADDNVATDDSGRIYNTDLLRVASGGAPVLDGVMTLSSFDSDGFTVNWPSDPAGTAMVIHYLALGGSDITNVYVGHVLTGTGTGNFSTTAPGFTPDLLFGGHIFTNQTTYSGASLNFCLYAASRLPSIAQMSASFASRDANTNAIEHSYQRTDKFFHGISVSSSTITFEGTLVSFDTNGWTGNVGTSPGGDVLLPFMAIKGGQYAVVSDTQKTTTGTQAKTGVGFQPKGALFFGTSRASSTSIDTGSTSGRFFIGASDGTNEGAIAAHHTDGLGTMDVNRYHVTDKAIVSMTGPNTVTGAADLQSFDSGGYTLNWTTTDGTAREFIGILFGAASAGSTYEKTGSAASAFVASGAGVVDWVKTGNAQSAGVASGASVQEWVKEGNAQSAVVASGAGVQDWVKTGSGVLEAVTSADEATDYVKTGYAVLDAVVSGPQSVVKEKTGSAATELVASGARDVDWVKTGSAASDMVASGDEASDYTKTGSAVLEAVASGDEASDYTKTGYAATDAVVSGAKTVTAGGGTTYTKTGFAATGTDAIYPWTELDPDTPLRPDGGIVGMYPVGAKATDYAKDGSAASEATAAGDEATDYAKAGAGEVGASASGVRVTEWVKAGSAEVGASCSGVQASPIPKAGKAAGEWAASATMVYERRGFRGTPTGAARGTSWGGSGSTRGTSGSAGSPSLTPDMLLGPDDVLYPDGVAGGRSDDGGQLVGAGRGSVGAVGYGSGR